VAANPIKRVPAVFYCNSASKEPVRDWLKKLAPADRKILGLDIATVEFGWPVGMPLCKALGQGLWEVRSNLTGNRISRVVFCVHAGQMVLLHAFIKKTQKTPPGDLALAQKRKKEIEQ
jgi:phage-related protein